MLAPHPTETQQYEEVVVVVCSLTDKVMLQFDLDTRWVMLLVILLMVLFCSPCREV